MAGLSNLAMSKALVPQASPDGFVEVGYGLVTAYDAGGSGSPPTMSVKVDGFDVVRSNCVWPMNSYTPTVDDTVICLLVGLDTVVLGKVPSA